MTSEDRQDFSSDKMEVFEAKGWGHLTINSINCWVQFIEQLLCPSCWVL